MDSLKRCHKCETEKPVSEFYKRASNKDGLEQQCKACIVEQQRKRYVLKCQENRDVLPVAEGTRICVECRVEKSIDQFNKHMQGPGGRRSQCRTCLTVYRKKLSLKYQEKFMPPASGVKFCKRCKSEHPVSEFPKGNNAKTGLASYCKQCCKNRNRDLKIEILSHYSEGDPFCVCCGETELDFLTIDHVNNDGAQHRREIGGAGTTTYLWLKRNGFPAGFAISCWNCNITRARFGSCPHQRQKVEHAV